MIKKSGFFVVAVLLAISLAPSPAQSSSEEDAVRAAVLDYVEGVYNVEPARIERSVHPNLTKLGFGKRSEDAAYRSFPMTYEQLVELAGRYNKDGHVASDAPKEIIVYEVLDQTASVKLVAVWGIDYMHLAKFDGKWKIINVLWQTHPK